MFPIHNANKRSKSASRWKRAYQAIKHNRTQSITKATVDNMINALGALYILNLYYADERFWFETPIEHRRQYTSSSEIFTPALCDTTKLPIGTVTDHEAIRALTNPTFEESIFILKYTGSAYRSMQDAVSKLIVSVNVKAKRSAHDKGTQLTIDGYEALARQEIGIIRDAYRELVHKEVILNKNVDVYP